MTLEEALANKDLLTYRQGAIGLVFNSENQILIAQMLPYKEDQWRFPGGGIDKGEKPADALIREFSEEMGSDKFEVIGESKYKAKFDWNDESITLRYKQKGELFRGQEQHQFIVKFKGKKEELSPDPKELKQIKWVEISELPNYLIFKGQWELTEKVLKEFDIL